MPLGVPPEIYGYQTLHREIGYYVSRLEKYDIALKFFDEAIKKTAKDKRALIGRARARTQVVQYEGALEDVNKAIGFDPDDLVLLAEKAFNTYLCCEFEQGLVQNSRLVPKRQKPDTFSMGVMQCSDAIENCLGERAGRPLRDHFKIIRNVSWKKTYAAQKPFEPMPTQANKKKGNILSKLLEKEGRSEPKEPTKLKRRGKDFKMVKTELNIRDSLKSLKQDDNIVPKFSKPFPFRPMQNYTTNIENLMAEKYLDAMYLDKIFLKKLQIEPGAKSPNQEGTKRIHQLAKNCFKTVSHKQELLRTRRPFYFIKYQQARVSGALKDRQKIELEIQRSCVRKDAESLCGRMLEAYRSKEIKTFLELVEKLKLFCDSRPKKLLPDKNRYMTEIYDKTCSAFYEVYRISPGQSLLAQDNRILGTLGLPLSREPSSDSVLDQFKNIYLDNQKMIKLFSGRLMDATSVPEICWYYHELSRFEYESNHYDLCRLYAKKCIKEAKSINNFRWIFNSSMMMLKANLAEHNKNDAKNDLTNAMTCARALHDEDKIRYLKQCQDIVEDVEFEDMFGTKQLEKRENKIIQMMACSKMKDEVAHLFRQMAAMPASRRMNVMPGVRPPNEKDKAKPAKARMSIMPGTKDPQGQNTVQSLLEY